MHLQLALANFAVPGSAQLKKQGICNNLHIPSHTIQCSNKEVFVKLMLIPQDGALLQRH